VLLSNEVIGGTVKVKFVDADPDDTSATNLLIDYLRVRSEAAEWSTSLVVKARTGDTTPPDGDWCNFENNTENDSMLDGRYVQYQIDLSTTDNTKTPTLYDITIIFLGEVAPNKPTSLQPSARQTTTSVSISCVVMDNNYDAINVFFYEDNATHSLIDNVWIDSGGTATRTWSGLTRGQTYTFFAKGQDNNNNWGDNSDTQSFKVNSLPTVPTDFTDLGMNLTDHTPTITWTKGTDAEEDTVTTYVYVGTTPYPTTVETYTTGTTADLGSVVTLSDGETYQYRLRSWDGYEWSDYTSDDTFRMNTPPVASNQKAEGQVNPTSLTTPIPLLSWDFFDSDGDSQTQRQIQVGTVENDNSMWDSTVSTSVTSATYAGSALSSGVTYRWRVRVFDNYEWSSWLYGGTFKLNFPPNKPMNLNVFSQTSTSAISAFVTDKDGDRMNVFFYDDATKSLIDNVWVNNGTAAMVIWSGLTLGENYTFYARAQDNRGLWSENSDTLTFQVGQTGGREPLWRYATGNTIFSVSISSDGSYTAAGSDDHKVYLFSKDSSTPLWSYKTGGNVKSVTISSDGSYIAAGSDDHKVYLFSKDSSTPLWSYKTGGNVKSVAISSDGSYIAAGSDDHKVYLFSKDSSTPLWSYKTGGNVKSVTISSDGSYIAAGSDDDKVYLLSKDSSTPLWSYKTGGNVKSVTISSDGSYIAACDDGKVYLFSKDSSTPLWIYTASGTFVSVSAIVPFQGC
jgi:WD40 repeat protein